MNAKELHAEMSEVVHFIETPVTGWNTGLELKSWWEMPKVIVEIDGRQHEVTGVSLHNASKTVFLEIEE